MCLRDLSSGGLLTCFLNSEINHDLLERYETYMWELRKDLEVWPEKWELPHTGGQR